MQCAISSDAIQLYQLPLPREVKQTITGSLGVSQLMEYCHPHPYRPINKEVRGSCSTYSTRRNVTSDVVESNMGLDKVMER